jgi:CubicO group peptidase (beta-lactamase class C family)
MYRCNDVIEFVLSKPVVAEPGNKFNYSNGVATVVGTVIKNACGMDVDRFAQETLFSPLGIDGFLWTRYPDGSIETDGGLALRSRDLAKIGQLFLKNGRWEERQVIPVTWIQESTKRRISLSASRGFGYYWNEMILDVNGDKTLAFFAPGDGGQFLAVLPALDMVFVATAGNYGANPTTTYWNLIRNYILPAVVSPAVSD